MKVNGNFGPVDIAVSGLRAQNKQMEVISSNIANAQTTDAGKGQPYRRREVMFKTDDDLSGVQVDRIATDMSDFLKVMEPGSPRADADGYVSLPNVKLPVEMMNLTVASRMYQANVAILRRYQQLVETTLELLR